MVFAVELLSVVVILLCISFERIETVRLIYEDCKAQYSDGSLAEPCGYCRICVKRWDKTKHTTVDHCDYTRWVWHNYWGASPFDEVWTGKYPQNTCNAKLKCDSKCRPNCKGSPYDVMNKDVKCVNTFNTCKCVCRKERYGQYCEHNVPSGLSQHSFADVQNIVFPIFVYHSNLFIVALYFYTTGINLNVSVTTERENLTYNSESCKIDMPSSIQYCIKIYDDDVIWTEDMKECKGGSSYEGNNKNVKCTMHFVLSFSKVRPTEYNELSYIRNYKDETNFPNRTVIAKNEAITVKVFNEVSTLPTNTSMVFHDSFGVVVFYTERSSIEKCPPFVTINKYGRTMYNVPNFTRRKTISVTTLVVYDTSPECEDLGNPVINWLLWNVKVNHNENDQPIKQVEAFNMIIPSFTLDYGMFKIKSEVRLVGKHFSQETAYCYFEIVKLPLQPNMIGGNVRYIYYNATLELIAEKIEDLNFPEDNQPELIHIWMCNDTEYFCQKTQTEDLIVTLAGPFTPGKVYNFSVEVVSPRSALRESSSEIIIVSKDHIPNLLVICLRNCGGKGFKSDTKEIVYFKVIRSRYSPKMRGKNRYTWSYSTGGKWDENIDQIRQKDKTPNRILIVEADTLKTDQRYTFRVVGGKEGEPAGEAQITIETFKEPKVFDCHVIPKTGIACQTKFSINCTISKQELSEFSLTFLFYDEVEGHGVSRLLGSTFVEYIDNVFLSKGYIGVYATNMYGQFKEAHAKVTLTKPDITSEFLQKSLENLKTMSESQGYGQKISLIATICDILNKNTTLKQEYVETFLEIINKEEPADVVTMELILSATQGVLCSEEQCELESMTEKSFKDLNQILSKVSRKLKVDLIQTSDIISELTTVKVKKLYNAFLDCAGVSVQAKDPRLLHNIKADSFQLYEVYKFSNLETIKGLTRINEGLAIRNLPFVKPTIFENEKIHIWIKEDVPSFFTNESNFGREKSFVKLSPELAEFLSNKFDNIVLQLMTFNDNPYWWSQPVNVSTQVLTLSIGYITSERRKYKSITTFKYPIEVYLRKNADKNETVSGYVVQPDPEDNYGKLDLSVAVHKLFPPKGAKISLRFVDLGENDSLRVVVTINSRPDYDTLLHSTTITKTSPWYHSTKTVQYVDDIVFLGILPGANVSIGKTLQYKFQLQSARCQVWHDQIWTTTGCTLRSQSTDKYLHCQCNHLSSIGGFLAVPMNTVDPFKDYKLFLTLPDNPFVFAFISSIFLIFLIFLIWCCKRDSEDTHKTSIIVLEDNISSDLFGYLLIVYTGSRLCSSTSSNIGIIIHGSDTSSRSHILRSSKRQTLKKNYDDWFLLFTPRHLGTISSIQLWSDHSGPNPNWFCDKILIHDLSSKTDYTFILSKWLGVTQVQVRVETFVRPIRLEKEAYFVDFFLTNTIFGFRESHLWVSIIARHPRSPVSRSERLSMAMVALLAMLLTSIMFYDATIPGGEDAAEYNIGMQDVLISIYSLIISIIITLIVYIAFSKSYIYYKSKDDTVYHKTQKDTRLCVDKVETLKVSKKAKHDYIYYFKKAVLSMRKERFYPVQATEDKRKQFVVVHKIRAIFAWVLCMFVIITTCYFIILYGLKIGKVKSLLWLTSIGLALGQDAFVMDPAKILFVSIIFGLVQTQFCDLNIYDPHIYTMRKTNIKVLLARDQFIHKRRLQSIYKAIPTERLQLIKNQHLKIKKWWAFIDIIDITFPVLIIFFIITQVIYDKFKMQSMLSQLLFKNLKEGDNFIPTPMITNVSTFSQYVQNIIFPAIYATQWYNEQSMTDKTELFPNTGWTLDGAHRIMGVPRLRQIRVRRELCTVPSLLNNLSFYCNVEYSPSTEDTYDYGTGWRVFSWVDVVFTKSPWVYLEYDNSTSRKMYGDSGIIFHGGGYVAELERTRKKSANMIWSLDDAGWLDIRTRIVFFEMTVYNVNLHVFTTIIFMTEHLGSTLILAGENIWSVIIIPEEVLYEVVYLIYATLALVKLYMIMNTIGTHLFFSSFWTVYDLALILIGMYCFIMYRIFLEIASVYIKNFQEEGKDTFFQFQMLTSQLHFLRKLLGLLLIFVIARALRLLKYGSRIISIKYKYTLYFSWPYILCITLVLMMLLFIIQRFCAALANTLYFFNFSHLVLYKTDFLGIYKYAINQGRMFLIFLPCFISCSFTFLFIMVFVRSFAVANIIYEREKQKVMLK